MTSPYATPPADEQARQHLATLLLASAVQVTHALDRLHQLAASDTHDNPAATVEVTDAVITMDQVRAQLINAADQLIQ